MSNPKRIPVDVIQAMKKILDALPDKNCGKTKEEALTLLNSHIQTAYSKGYSVKELAAIMVKGNVAVSAPTLRAHTCPSTKKMRKAKSTTEESKQKTMQPKTIPAQKAEVKKEPAFFTPDIPDTEL